MIPKRIFASLLTITLASFVLAISNANAGADLRMRTGLAGAQLNGMTPKGKAEYRERANRQLTVQVENINLPDGTTVNVLINGNGVGQISLLLTRGQLQLNTNDNQNVPTVIAGTTVVVTDANGSTLVAGVF